MGFFPVLGRVGRALFHLGLCIAADARCLPDAVPDEDRAYIKDITGKDVEVRLIAFDWPSAEFVTALGNQALCF